MYNHIQPYSNKESIPNSYGLHLMYGASTYTTQSDGIPYYKLDTGGNG